MINNLAVSFILGVIFSEDGPGYSRLKIFSPETPSKGNKAIVKTTTPSPPNHWRKDLQKRILLGVLSISTKIVAPVVVTPETASKRALEYPSKLPERKNGIEPKNEAAIQHNTITKKTSLLENDFAFL